MPCLTSHLPLFERVETGEDFSRAAASCSLSIIILRHSRNVTHSSVMFSHLCMFITIVQLVVSNHWSINLILSWEVNSSEEPHMFHWRPSLTRRLMLIPLEDYLT